MGKNVFRSGEFNYRQHKVFLQAPERRAQFTEAIEVEDALDEYTGPTADDLRREAEAFKQSWDAQRETMVSEAKTEAERIILEAEDQAFRQVKEKTEAAQAETKQAEEDAETIRAQAQKDAERIVAEAEEKAKAVEHDAFERGRRQGEETGIEQGKTEVQRVIERFHVVLSKAIERRNDIIQESEAQVVSLVLAIAKKVIKVISENQKNVVINNIVESLQKLKAKSDVIVRVNLSDLDIATRHKEDILKMAERVQTITIAEDTTVDPGGCIIETDFGEIDARIASQLREIEDRILELVPITSHARSGG